VIFSTAVVARLKRCPDEKQEFSHTGWRAGGCFADCPW
jgi:hypothetical protein